MKKILYSFLSVLMATVSAINAGWKLSGVIDASYSETAVSDNWEDGETDARSWVLRGDGAAEQNGTKTNWLNTLTLEYGKASLAEEPEQETADLINLDSVYSYKCTEFLNPYIALTSESQFTEFFSPSLLGESAGMAWIFIRKEDLNLRTRLGAALRQTFARGIGTETEAGAEWITNYDLKLNRYVKFVSKLDLFSAFDAGADARLDASLYVKINKYLTVRSGYLVVYDYRADLPRPELPDDIRTRFTFGLGISYNFF